MYNVLTVLTIVTFVLYITPTLSNVFQLGDVFIVYDMCTLSILSVQAFIIITLAPPKYKHTKRLMYVIFILSLVYLGRYILFDLGYVPEFEAPQLPHWISDG